MGRTLGAVHKVHCMSSSVKAVFKAVMADSPDQLRSLVESGAPVSGPNALNSAGKSPKEVAKNRSKALALAYLEQVFELTVTSVADLRRVDAALVQRDAEVGPADFQVKGLTFDTTIPQLRAKVAEVRGVEPETVRLILVDGSEQTVLHDKASAATDQTLGGSGALHLRWSIRMAIRDAAVVEEAEITAVAARRVEQRAIDGRRAVQRIAPRSRAQQCQQCDTEQCGAILLLGCAVAVWVCTLDGVLWDWAGPFGCHGAKCAVKWVNHVLSALLALLLGTICCGVIHRYADDGGSASASRRRQGLTAASA